MKFYLTIAISAIASIGAAAMLSPDRLLRSLSSLAGIIGLVTLICMVTSILEQRGYLRVLTKLARPLTRFGRLPEPGCRALIASFASGSVAAMMLAESEKNNRLTRREMVFCALCTTIPPLFLFNCYLMAPIIGILGMLGVWYFLITGSILMASEFLFLSAARFYFKHSASPLGNALPELAKSWQETWYGTRKNTIRFLRRLLLLTVPFYLGSALALERGWLSFRLPAHLAEFLSPEALAVIGARLGGLMASAGCAAEFMTCNAAPARQLLSALLIGNILNGLTRLLRRGLPVSMGIYPGYSGGVIAAIAVGTRLILTAVVILCMEWEMI